MSRAEQLTPEQEYQRDYYRAHKEERTQEISDKWQNDPRFRRKEQLRNRRRRALLRAKKAPGRLQEMIDERRAERASTRPPRFVVVGGRVEGDRIVGGRVVQVWTTGSLGREVGRTSRAVRDWLRSNVLPGASAFTSDGRAWFSRAFCEAVYRACKQLYFLNGRGDRRVLARLVREELDGANVHFVPTT